MIILCISIAIVILSIILVAYGKSVAKLIEETSNNDEG